MPKQKIILIVGIVLAVLAVFMTKLYIDQQRKSIIDDARKKLATAEAEMRKNQTAVLVAKNDIPKGVAIEPEMFAVEIIPNQYVQPQAVTSLDRIAGMMTVAGISKGEQITLTKLTYPKQLVGGGLSGLTPVGKRAVTISVDNLASVAGMINPGDYVDVMALLAVPTETPDKKRVTEVVMVPLFQNVLVLAVGQDIGQPQPQEGRYKKEGTPEASPLITLALTPQEANLIAFIQEQGKIRLVLRSPADSKIEPVQPAGWDTLFQYVMPQELAAPRPGKESKPTEYVEIYRGLSKERIPISQE